MSKLVNISRVIIVIACLAAPLFAGCERKERVLDVRTPSGNVTVDRNLDNGRVDVKTGRK
jgi:hypothetical protein